MVLVGRLYSEAWTVDKECVWEAILMVEKVHLEEAQNGGVWMTTIYQLLIVCVLQGRGEKG